MLPSFMVPPDTLFEPRPPPNREWSAEAYAGLPRIDLIGLEVLRSAPAAAGSIDARET